MSFFCGKQVYMTQVEMFAVELRIELGEVLHRITHCVDQFRKDLQLFAALSFARFIVWKELRRRVNKPRPRDAKRIGV